MTNSEFIECWEAACRHPFASFRSEETGGMGYFHYWIVSVGWLELRAYASPYDARGRWPKESLRLRSGTMDGCEPLTNEQSIRCVNIWEVRQCLDGKNNHSRVMEYLSQPIPG